MTMTLTRPTHPSLPSLLELLFLGLELSMAERNEYRM